MRRLLRWTFHALAAASLLLCLATAALWVRSYRACDLFYAARQEASENGRRYDAKHFQCRLISDRGHFDGYLGWSERPEDEFKPPWQFKLRHPDGHLSFFSTFRFRSDREVNDGYAYSSCFLGTSAWSLVAAFAVLPAIFAFRQVRAVRRRRRARLGCCPACGYDLRATPERCPECGRSAKPGEGATRRGGEQDR
jgi:hypothetical protein